MSIKSVLGQVLGWRKLLLAVLAAVIGGALLAGAGVLLWHAALPGVTTRYPASIRLTVGIAYGAVGAVGALVSVLLGAAGRAVSELRPLIRPAVGRCAAATVVRLPATGAGVEIAQVEALMIRVCDSIIVNLPALRLISRVASALAKRRLQKLADPYLSPLRETGRRHVSLEALQLHATDACTSALLDLAREQITRPRLIVYLTAACLLAVPLCIACVRLVAGTPG